MLEMVPTRALRCLYPGESYCDILRDKNIPTVHEREASWDVHDYFYKIGDSIWFLFDLYLENKSKTLYIAKDLTKTLF